MPSNSISKWAEQSAELHALDGNIFLDISLDRINSVNTHGTGCSFSSAIASFIAHGNDLDEAFRLAKNYVWKGIKESYSIGQGNGPINHMWDN